jgi:hypothetical protein
MLDITMLSLKAIVTSIAIGRFHCLFVVADQQTVGPLNLIPLGPLLLPPYLSLPTDAESSNSPPFSLRPGELP